MKALAVIATVSLSVVLQMTLARYTVGGRWAFDLVLVGVVYAALCWGPVAGMLAGTAGGLIQDALAGGLLGVDGLAKTIVGFAVGVASAQFIVTRTLPRMAMVAAATIGHRALLLLLRGLIDQRWPGVDVPAILWETAVNALAGFLAFQVTESLPGAIQRRRMGRRTPFSRRQW